jgi:hypothetical protein
MVDISSDRATAVHCPPPPPKIYDLKYENDGKFPEGARVGYSSLMKEGISTVMVRFYPLGRKIMSYHYHKGKRFLKACSVKIRDTTR